MKIYGSGNDPLRPHRPDEVQRRHPEESRPARRRGPHTQVPPSDRVEISPAGRQRSDRMHALPIDAPDRLSAIRDRVLSGAYEADDVVAEVARRILDRGDV